MERLALLFGHISLGTLSTLHYFCTKERRRKGKSKLNLDSSVIVIYVQRDQIWRFIELWASF